MALRVWLPLNGTLENKGISDVTVTNNSATFSTDGKIGNKSCNGRFDFTTIPTSDAILNNGNFSISFWAKINIIPTSTGETATYILKCGANATRTCLHIAIRSSGEMAFCFYSDDYTFLSSVTPYIGIWTHFAFTYSNLTQCAYVNGELVGTRKTGGDLIVGDNSSFIVYNNPTQLNDLRIYDHCLSPKEVKEISQGLVLHYKLDGWSGGAGENLLHSTIPSAENVSKLDGGSYLSFVTEDSFPCYKFTGGNTRGINFNPNIILEANTTYIYSAIIKSTVGGNFGFTRLGHFQVYNSASTASDKAHEDVVANRIYTPQTINANEWTKITITFTTNNLSGSSFRIFPIYNTSNDTITYLRDLKLEKGSVATSWSPTPAEIGVDTTKVTDSSGYGHDGITSNAPIAVEDSARYGICTKFNGNNQYIRNDIQMKNNYPTDEITVSWWGYMNPWSSYGRAISCTEGGGWNFEPASGYMRWAIGTGVSSNTYITTCTSMTALSELSSGWHHFVGTYDGLNAKIYIDGILEKTITSYTTKTPLFYANVYLYIGCEASATSPYFNGKLSDVRVYATALSAEDILDLYHTSANVDNLQNIHTFELKDNEDTSQTLKNGIMATEEFHESNSELLNSFSSGGYAPAKDKVNSCVDMGTSDFTNYADLNKDLSIHIECDIEWTAFTAGTGGTFKGIWWQGSNYKKETSAYAWEGANYVCSILNSTKSLQNVTTVTSPGKYHYDVTTTIPASWFNTYSKSNIGFRCDYSDGTGRIDVTNFKITPSQYYNAKIGKDFISANNFIEK